MKKLVIFDLDGTLLNTINDLGEACNHVLKEHGYPVHPIPSYNFMVGGGIRNLLRNAHPDCTPELLEELVKDFHEYYDEHCLENTHPYKGIPELLENLRQREIAMAVASNKYQKATEKICRHFFPDIPFVAIEGEIEGRPRKPDPSIIFSVLLKHPVEKAGVLYIGDSGVDIETAQRAGVEGIGVSWGFRPISELRKAHADYIINTPAEVLDHLEDPF